MSNNNNRKNNLLFVKQNINNINMNNKNLIKLFLEKNYQELIKTINNFPELCKLSDNNGNTILHYVISHFRTNPHSQLLFKTIISADCLHEFINKQNKDGDTPLHIAIKIGADDVADVLLANDANPSIRNNDDEYVSENEGTVSKFIELAKERNFDEIYNQIHNCDNMLLSKNGENNIFHYLIKDYSLNTPLIQKILQELLKKSHAKELLNMKNSEGDTPLHLAIKNNLNDVADILCKYGADKSIINNEGYCVSEMSSTNEFPRKSEQQPIRKSEISKNLKKILGLNKENVFSQYSPENEGQQVKSSDNQMTDTDEFFNKLEKSMENVQGWTNTKEILSSQYNINDVIAKSGGSNSNNELPEDTDELLKELEQVVESGWTNNNDMEINDTDNFLLSLEKKLQRNDKVGGSLIGDDNIIDNTEDFLDLLENKLRDADRLGGGINKNYDNTEDFLNSLEKKLQNIDKSGGNYMSGTGMEIKPNDNVNIDINGEGDTENFLKSLQNKLQNIKLDEGRKEINNNDDGSGDDDDFLDLLEKKINNNKLMGGVNKKKSKQTDMQMNKKKRTGINKNMTKNKDNKSGKKIRGNRSTKKDEKMKKKKKLAVIQRTQNELGKIMDRQRELIERDINKGINNVIDIYNKTKGNKRSKVNRQLSRYSTDSILNEFFEKLKTLLSEQTDTSAVTNEIREFLYGKVKPQIVSTLDRAMQVLKIVENARDLLNKNTGFISVDKGGFNGDTVDDDDFSDTSDASNNLSEDYSITDNDASNDIDVDTDIIDMDADEKVDDSDKEIESESEINNDNESENDDDDDDEEEEDDDVDESENKEISDESSVTSMDTDDVGPN